MHRIPFRNIPDQPALYYDYLDDSPRLRQFYNGHHRNEADLARLAKNVLHRDYSRGALAQVLQGINRGYGMTDETQANLELLEQEETLTVITGQQCNIYTGPFYTIAKALTTIKVAARISETLNLPVVPMFWMESSDHEYAIVNHIYLPVNHEPKKFTYGGDITNQQPVGGLKLGNDVEEFARRIKQTLPANDFYDAVTRLMDEAYSPGAALGEAFGKMLTRLLGRWGLIIVDSENPELKRLAAPIIAHKLEEKGRINQLMVEQSEELEKEHYEQQIKVRSELLNLFILKDNNRIPLTVLGEVLANGEEKMELSEQELVSLAQEHPERFSPKVAFRPIVQDFLLPNVAYIGGPSELAYFAQLKKVYEFFEIEMPIIWPRVSTTLIDSGIQRHIEKAGIEPQDVFRKYGDVVKDIMEDVSNREYDKLFRDAEARVDELILWLKDRLAQIDPSMTGQLDKPFSKIHYQMESIKQKTMNRLTAKNQSLVNSLRTAQSMLYPRRRLQERTYNIIHYLSRHGFWLLDYLMENFDIDTDDHHMLEVPSLHQEDE